MAKSKKKGKGKISIRKILAADLGKHSMGHNRRVSPFDREDIVNWKGVEKKLAPFEQLVAQWLVEAETLKSNGQKKQAKIINKHIKELRKAVSKA